VWLTSFDPEGAWPPTEISLMERVQVGVRDDLAWADVAEPIALGAEQCARVLLQARHEGHSVWSDEPEPIHVYVCTTNGAHESEVLQVDNIRIRAWGLLYRDRP
jgi:hypothetical protein